MGARGVKMLGLGRAGVKNLGAGSRGREDAWAGSRLVAMLKVTMQGSRAWARGREDAGSWGARA